MRHATGWSGALLAIWVLWSGAATAIAGPGEGTTPTLAEIRGPETLRREYVRIGLRYPGLYRVTGADLAAQGVDLAKVNPNALRLESAGKAVPVLVNASGAEMKPTDSVEFYGVPPQGTYSAYLPNNLHNIYLLSWSAIDSPPLQYARQQGSAVTAETTTGARFWSHRRVERDLRFQYLQGLTVSHDGFLMANFYANAPSEATVNVAFPGYAAEDSPFVELTMRLHGLTNVSSLRPQHLFDVYDGDKVFGRVEFNGQLPQDFRTTLSRELARDGLRLNFLAPTERETAVDTIGLDYLLVRYPRRFDMEQRPTMTVTADLTTSASFPASVGVKNVPVGTRLFDPERGRMQELAVDPAGWAAVKFEDAATTGVLVAADAVASPDFVQYRKTGASLENVPPGTEALLVYGNRLADSAQAYAKYRQAQGVKLHAVAMEQVSDALSDGYLSDVTLKRYIRYVYDRAPKMKYVVLWGDSTLDYREATDWENAYPRDVHIPMHWVINPSVPGAGGYTDDNWYGVLVPNGNPALAVGRVPANNNAEGLEFLRKIIEHEQIRGTKNKQVLMVSSVEAEFQSLINDTVNRIRDAFTTVTISFPKTDKADLEVQRLKDAINEGTQVLYYVGHGGSFVWRVGPVDFNRQKDLFAKKDVEALTNESRYPIIVASSCYTTSFNETESIGEAFVLLPRRGAVAVIGTPWKAGVYESHSFNLGLLSEYIDKKNRRLGDVLIRAFQRARPNPQGAEFQTFTLLGDPLLELVRMGDKP